jgi:hypothetical protein
MLRFIGRSIAANQQNRYNQKTLTMFSRWCLEMKRLELISLCLLTVFCLQFAGCGDPNRARLVGTWNISRPERIAGRLDRAEPAAEKEKEIELPPKMQIQFRRNGGLATITHMGSMTPSPKQGTWQMLEFDEASQTMRIKCQIGLQESEHEIQFLDQNSIKLVPPNLAGLSLKLKFERQ